VTDQTQPPAGRETGTSGDCPSCGRFVGPYEKCPYCGADIGQRMSIRVFKYGSLVLAILGLAVLLYAAIQSDVPTVEVGDLVGTMNWAYVRVEGTVIRQPTFDPETESLKLWVWDGTGEIMVTAYRSEADWLVENDRVPAMGDAVALEGTLRVREDFQYLILNVPQHTEVWPAEPLTLSIADVNPGLLYQPVTVQGVIREERIPYEGLHILTLRDATGEIDVTLPTSTTLWGGDLPALRVGQSVQVTGAVDQYKGTPQISAGRGSDVVILDEAIALAPARTLGSLSAADAESMAAVEGTIIQVNPFSAGVKFILDDGTGEVTLLLWQNVYDSLANRSELAEGAVVRAQGEVAEYKGELEIVPDLASDVMVLAPAERTATRPLAAERQLGEISVDDVGQAVSVEGVLKSLRGFSAGMKGVLDDGTGQVILLLWQDVYDGLDDPESLAPGAVLRVEGEVAEYKGEMEVVPQAPADVVVVGQVELPSEEVPIGQLSVADVGQRVQVAGQILEVTLFSAGAKYTLDDGTGAIILLLWQDLYEQDERFATLAEGASVSVRGEVAEYQGDLEIIPQVPADVEVTRGGSVAQVTSTPTPGLEAEPTSPATDMPEPTVEATSTPTPTLEPTATPPSKPTAEPTPTPEPQAEVKKIGQIVWNDIGQTFAIKQAAISEAWWTSGGANFQITDGTGILILFIFQDDYEGMSFDFRYDLVSGTVLDVTGEIGEYRGDLEIIPRKESDFKLRAAGEKPPLEERAIANITPSDVGRWFAIEGGIQDVQTSSMFTKLIVGDGTGQIVVLLWQNIYERVPNQEQLNPGARVRVVGQFGIYEKGGNEFQIVPRTGADVEVLP